MFDIIITSMSLRTKAQGFDDSDATLASKTVESPLCQYLEQFDGTAKDFADVRPYFNELFSEIFIYCADGRTLDRQAFINMNKYLLDSKMIATLEDIYFSDDTHVEYTVHWGNDNLSMVSHVIGIVDEGKIIKLEPCPETSGVFANMLGPRWRKAIAVNIDKRVSRMKTWALIQRVPRAA